MDTWIVRIADDWSGATLQVTAPNSIDAQVIAIKTFSKDRRRPLDLNTARMSARPVV